MACQKLGQMVQKNEDISNPVNSIETGAICLYRLGQDPSRDTIIMFSYAFERDPSWRIGLGHAPEK